MKKVIIRNLDNKQIDSFCMNDPYQLIEERILKNYYGKSERLENGVNLPADYTISIEDIDESEINKDWLKNRLEEYPTMNDFLNAFFDGGESALEELQQKRLLVKEKYPK
jgi:hypothetical protein